MKSRPWALRDAEPLVLKARSVLKAISKKYKYNPTLTLLLPIVVNIPLFLLLSAVIRHGCVPPTPWSGELAPFPWAAPSADLQAKFAASAKLLADRGLDAQQVAMMAPKAGPSLIEKDPTGFGGVLFGMVTLLSVELGNWRRNRMQAGANELAQEPPQPKPRPVQPGKAPQTPAADAVTEKKMSVNSLRQMILSNSMRGLGILLIPVAMHVPCVSTPAGLEHLHTDQRASHCRLFSSTGCRLCHTRSCRTSSWRSSIGIKHQLPQTRNKSSICCCSFGDLIFVSALAIWIHL